MQIGDLVRRELNYPVEGYAKTRIGLVIAKCDRINDHHVHYKIMWNGGYGTFWSPEEKLKVVSSV